MRRPLLPLAAVVLGLSTLAGCTTARSVYDDVRYPDRQDTRYPDRNDRYPDRNDRYDGRVVAQLPGGSVVLRDRTGRLVVRSRDGRYTDYGRGRAAVCHRGRTVTVSDTAVNAHLRHGDRFGACDRRYDRGRDDDNRRYERDDDDRHHNGRGRDDGRRRNRGHNG